MTYLQQLQQLERACNIQVAEQAAGNAELIFPPREVVEKVEQQAKVFASGEGPGVARHWNALIRQLERSEAEPLFQGLLGSCLAAEGFFQAEDGIRDC